MAVDDEQFLCAMASAILDGGPDAARRFITGLAMKIERDAQNAVLPFFHR